MPRVESIPEDLVIGEEVLQSALNCAKHFATLILKSVWPELFGPQQRRMAYNWNGTRGKTPLDERRKRVVEIYTHFYFPETRHQKVWLDVVGRINERMKRQWRKKSSQRNEAYEESSGEEDGENRDPNERVLTSVDQNDDLSEIAETMFLFMYFNPYSASHNCSRRHFEIVLIYFSEKISRHFMRIVCMAGNLHK